MVSNVSEACKWVQIQLPPKSNLTNPHYLKTDGGITAIDECGIDQVDEEDDDRDKSENLAGRRFSKFGQSSKSLIASWTSYHTVQCDPHDDDDDKWINENDNDGCWMMFLIFNSTTRIPPLLLLSFPLQKGLPEILQC